MSDTGNTDEPAQEPENASSPTATEKPPADKTPAATTATPARRGTRHRQLALIGVLLAALGFAIAVQVRANSSSDALASLRQSDLIQILDNQNQRADRLRDQIAQLQSALAKLRNTGDQSAAAQAQAKAQLQSLQILLGLIPATGPGVEVRIGDPDGKLGAEQLLDVVEELRGAGAEAIDFSGVRVSTDTAFVDGVGTIQVDGHQVRAPYVVTAIGDPGTLQTALTIPGGVSETLTDLGGTVTISQHSSVTITSVRTLPDYKYAVPKGN